MPYKSEKIKLPEKYDRRVKITAEQRQEIIDLYKTGDYSWRKLAAIYKVDKSRIGQIVNPAVGEKVKQRSMEHKQVREQNNKSVREHRKYKQQLYLEGKI